MSEIGLLLSGGGGAALIWATVALLKTFLSRKLVNADAAEKLAGTAVEMIEASQANAERSIAAMTLEVTRARAEASEARAEAAEARRAANDARREAEASNLFTRRLIAELFRPDATVERLRRLVNDGGGDAMLNGARL